MSEIGLFGVFRGHSRSVEIAPFYTVHTGVLLAFHSNYVPILHRFWDSKILVENRQL